jgi:hypothetical protein
VANLMLAASQHRSRRPMIRNEREREREREKCLLTVEDDKELHLFARLTRVIEVEEAVDNLVSLKCLYKSGRSIARREP